MTGSTDRPNVYLLDGSAPEDREVLGGKAYSVNRMRALDLPVPPAFALPTYECQTYHDAGRALSDEAWQAVASAVQRLEDETGRTFGRGPSPLLVSVRSGAAQSMPGMMDTVLNLGLNPDIVQVLGDESGDLDWAEDTWQRFRRGYRDIVLGGEGKPPLDPWEQLRGAIGAVFDSWTNERVRAYRERHNLGAGGGTAVTVQAMVFGNRDASSGTGVMFSRNPSTGEPGLYGEWLPQGQGEDVVSGEKTPLPLSSIHDRNADAYGELERIAAILEKEYQDLVDIEFTVESKRLYMLQSRVGKRSPHAAVRIAADLVREGMLTPEEGLAHITTEHVAALAGHSTADASAEVLAKGTAASPGVATGIAVTDVDTVPEHVANGESVVLVRTFTTPEDVPAMFDSVAVVTEVGGATSHAALVCREIGLPCVVGIGEGKLAGLEGKLLTVDGATGTVYEGHEDEAQAHHDEHVEFLIYHLRSRGTPSDHPLLALVDENPSS